MERPSLLVAVRKLAMAGERAGFSLEEMIGILNAGNSVEALLRLIARRLEVEEREREVDPVPSSHWIM